eukprot:3707813-Amphidinium_carterae.2
MVLALLGTTIVIRNVGRIAELSGPAKRNRDSLSKESHSKRNHWCATGAQRALSVLSMDLPISFFKGYITERGELEMKLSRVVRKYVRSGLPLDISLLSVEYTTFALILSLPDGRAARATRFLRMLRYTKSLKIGKMRRL